MYSFFSGEGYLRHPSTPFPGCDLISNRTVRCMDEKKNNKTELFPRSVHEIAILHFSNRFSA